jgi:hypothetical protein
MHIEPVTSPGAASAITFTTRGFAIGPATITTSHIFQKLIVRNKLREEGMGTGQKNSTEHSKPL